jgi:soluble epoxide hydrolase / lipid-phosphate phosphatase
MKNGIRGPCNWYRTRRVNYDDEISLPQERRATVDQPTLFVFATGDRILSEDLQKGMDKSIPNLTKGSVPASHWALWHTPVQTNELLRKWVEGVVFGKASKL